MDQFIQFSTTLTLHSYTNDTAEILKTNLVSCIFSQDEENTNCTCHTLTDLVIEWLCHWGSGHWTIGHTYIVMNFIENVIIKN